MALPGLVDWSNAIRFTMANDPGRSLFHDQVNTHGFVFLDRYLTDILDGTKQDPLIELVKTPGRKRAVTMKPKTASKLKNIVPLSLEDDEVEKENLQPINGFHQALLKVKDNTSGHAVHLQPSKTNEAQQARPQGRTHPFDETFSLEMPSTAPAVPVLSPAEPSSDPVAHATKLLAPSHSDQNELSVIAEDDESAERSHVFVRQEIESHRGSRVAADSLSSLQEGTSIPQRQITPPVSDLSHREIAQAFNSNEMSSDTFHSITLDSPRPPSQMTTTNTQSPSSVSAQPLSPVPTVSDVPVVKYQQPLDSCAAPLPEIPPWHSPQIHGDAVTDPPSVVPPVVTSAVHTGDLEIPLRDPDSTPMSPKGLTHKSSISLFPVLPAPVPLRKSMRATHDTSVGAATPGAVGGKRTSWLKKAREVKAMEGFNRHTSTSNTGLEAARSSGPAIPNALKRKSGDILIPAATGLENEERQHKSVKTTDGDVAPLKPRALEQIIGKEKEDAPVINMIHRQLSPQSLQPQPLQQEGMLDRFKRTVEGLGARVGKSMGKSLGAGAAANALAEARAAAEARVAERNHKEDEITRITSGPLTAPSQDAVTTSAEISPLSTSVVKDLGPLAIADSSVPFQEVERRLSISDLFPPNDGSIRIKNKASEKVFQPAPVVQAAVGDWSKANRDSTTTTPPDSPPASRPTNSALPSGPVFNKPPPVFVPPDPISKPLPITTSAKNLAFNHLPTTFSMPTPMPLDSIPPLPSHLSRSRPRQPVPLSSQSTLESIKSDAIFDDHEDVHTWIPNTQDTEYSSRFGSQSQEQRMNALDEDDSWPIDEKLAAGVQWTFGVGMGKEDSMTWSTLPSQSQRIDTGSTHRDQILAEHDEGEVHQTSRIVPGAFDVDMVDDVYEEDEEVVARDSELEEAVMDPGKSTISLVEGKTTRSQSQMSLVSSVSSQSQPGLLGQATKLLSSALGTSKKGKPEVKKVLQLAAVAAKKQQEENGKKAARLKEMENRRQLAIQRKAEEEKTRVQEQEKKLKEEGERRKREREENTDKRPLKQVVGKKEEDITKKRKVTVEAEKKTEIKKPPSTSKTALKSSLKQPAALSSSAAYNASLQTIAGSSTSKTAEPKPPKPSATAVPKAKGKAPANASILDDDISQPSQLMQIRMAARAKAQLQAAREAAEPAVQSESIELPDINSEYSDSEDEERPRTFDPPGWAQSPELRQALQIQSTINPDDIFGAIRPLRMEELFKTRTSRFRARTSSANWTGTDRLTIEEEREYARRMGFR